MTHEFCSRLAALGHGVIAGTGVQAEIYVFLPVSKQLWSGNGMNRRWASGDELAAIKAARRSGVLVRLYNPDAAGAAVLVHASPQPSPTAEAALEVLLAALSGQGWNTDRSGDPRLAVCTHGTRDRCCAKWGFAAYRQARSLHAAGRFPFQPIECSHLGGDRFAATGLIFPSGSMYGHLDELDLEALGQAESEGRFMADHYRGRVFETPVIQVIRAGLARDGEPIDAASVLDLIARDEIAGVAEVAIGARRLTISLGTKEVWFYGDCDAVEQKKQSRMVQLTYLGFAEA
jgi:hypothetical protein